MSAVDHLSLDQFKNLHSEDHGMPMHRVESEGVLDRHSEPWTYSEKHPVGYNDRLKGVSDSVAKEGIRDPITLSKFVSSKGEELLSVWDGHHRGVAAIRHGVDPVPVRVYDQKDLLKGRWG